MSKTISVEQFNRSILNAKETGLKQFKDGYVSGLRYEIKKDHVTSVLKYKTHLGNYTSKQLRNDIRNDISIDELSLLSFRQEALDFLKKYRETTEHQKITIIDLYQQYYDE